MLNSWYLKNVPVLRAERWSWSRRREKVRRRRRRSCWRPRSSSTEWPWSGAVTARTSNASCGRWTCPESRRWSSRWRRRRARGWTCWSRGSCQCRLTGRGKRPAEPKCRWWRSGWRRSARSAISTSTESSWIHCRVPWTWGRKDAEELAVFSRKILELGTQLRSLVLN